jgi:hypothetical protein
MIGLGLWLMGFARAQPILRKTARKQFAFVLYYLKYRRSGGFWPFFDGISKPSALSM